MEPFTKSEPLVWVGVPCFNRPEGLDRLLASITGQTFRDIEIFVSDNCSPIPDVQRIARRYADADSRVKVFRQPTNIGLLANHQFLLEQARGKFFMWAHDDDEFPLDYIEVCLRHFENAPDIVLVGPSCDRYLDGIYLSSYERHSSRGLTAFQRLNSLIEDGIHFHWRFEQYFSGLCLRDAMPTVISKESKAPFHLLFHMSERGSLEHASGLKFIKHSTRADWTKYADASVYKRHFFHNWFGRDLEETIPITAQMLTIIWVSRRLSVIEKVLLTLRCLSLFAAHPLRTEMRDRVRLAMSLIRAPLRKLFRGNG